MKNSKRWKIFITLTICLTSLAFIPAVIPNGITEPFLLGLPRTLWVSMGISLAIYVVLVAAMLTSKGE